MTTITVNLHDYIAINKRWEQLWADDNVAYWFERLTDDNTPEYAKGYKYQVHETTPYLDIITDNRSFYCKDLKQAFEQWNKLINNHIQGV
jgi:hypothetical protein